MSHLTLYELFHSQLRLTKAFKMVSRDVNESINWIYTTSCKDSKLILPAALQGKQDAVIRKM